MNQTSNPSWWTTEDDSAWERTKAAFKRDWDQTKHDFGGNEPDTDQDVNDTVKQAAGKQPIPPRGEPTYEEIEPAYRFGFGAQTHFGKDHEAWDNELEDQLRRDWRRSYPTRENQWKRDLKAIRRGWEYKP